MSAAGVATWQPSELFLDNHPRTMPAFAAETLKHSRAGDL